MSETDPSNEQNTRLDAKTRVDSAHGSPGGDIPLTADPPFELLLAVAGQDPVQAELQLRGQALELAGILEEKQKLLDERESQLNAKTAQLESELRHGQLAHRQKTPLDAGIDLSDGTTQTLDVDEAERDAVSDLQKETVKRWRDMLRFQETVETATPLETARSAPAPPQVDVVEHEPASAETEAPRAEVEPPPDEFREPFSAPAAKDPFELERQQIEQQRQALVRRKEKLDSRHQHVERMHEQVTSLHREALELQLSTEQLWSELVENFPSEELARRLSHTRNQLAEHFRITSENLAHRTDEMHQLRQELNEQESKLRQKRREIQMWADRRYDEIEVRTAELICRERELDRLEMEFDRQSIQWQQQRQAYREEIERLSGQLQR